MGNFASVNVGATIGVTIADVLIGSAATNYTLTQPSGLTASITPKTLGITGQLGAHKAYDATTAATLTGGTLTGVVGNDAVSLVQAGSFASVNVGTNIAISAANSLTGIGATNYQINQPTNLFANITPAILTVEGLAASSKVYDGTTTASLSGIAVARPLGGGQVTIGGSPSGAFGDKNVGIRPFKNLSTSDVTRNQRMRRNRAAKVMDFCVKLAKGMGLIDNVDSMSISEGDEIFRKVYARLLSDLYGDKIPKRTNAICYGTIYNLVVFPPLGNNHSNSGLFQRHLK